MKIAFLNIYSGVNNRGAESFAQELAGRLSGEHEVFFFYGGEPRGDEKYKVVRINAPVVQPHQGSYPDAWHNLLKKLFLDQAALSVLDFSLTAFPYLWRGKFDLLIPLNGFWQVLLCKVITLFCGGKILITGHSGPYWDDKWNLWLKPDIFVATTGPTQSWAKQVSPWTKVTLIPYGVDLSRFSQAKPRSLDLERPLILCPSAAVPYKRIDLAIAAVARLKKGSLLHLGEGYVGEEIKELGEKLLGPGRFASFTVSYTEMPEYYAAADLVTLPSLPQENSPMVYLEAMAAGKAVVTTDAPRARWILGEAGLFINPEDTDKYADALTRALKIKDRKSILVNADRFDWSNIYLQYEKLINEL